MKAVFLTKYASLGASSRYRAIQYIPKLQSLGWDCHVEPLLPNEYVRNLYGAERWSATLVARSLLTRMGRMKSRWLNSADVIYVQNELLPRVPFALESGFYRRHRCVVVDYDDAVFHLYQDQPLLRNKIRQVMASASHVLVGNRYLESYAREVATSVSVLPTVVDLDRYKPKIEYSTNGTPPVVGWIGTPFTVAHLLSYSAVFQRLAKRCEFILRCVGAPADTRIRGVEIEPIPWSEDTEVECLRGFDVGVMPLLDTPYSYGKCGLKLIQYMAAGVPAIGNRIGANEEIIDSGVNGLLATSEDEFEDRLAGALRSESMRAALGRAGRKTVEQRYSLASAAQRLDRILQETADRGQALQPGGTS